MSVEKEILKHLISDAANFRLVQDKNLKSAIFIEEADSDINRFRLLFDLAVDYYRNYSAIITRESLDKLLSVSKIRTDIASAILMAYDEVTLTSVSSPLAFLIDAAKKSYKKFKIKEGLLKSSEFYRSNDTDSIIPYLQQEFYSIAYATDEQSSETTLADSADYRLDAYSQAKRSPGVFSGFSSLDKATNGLYPGQLMVVAAATSEGKSVMLLNMAHNAWRLGKNVLYVTIENYRDDMLRRFDSLDAMVAYDHLKNGNLTDDERVRIQRALEEQKQRPNILHVVSKPDCTTDFIESKINDLQPLKFDVMFVDYLHIMKLGTKERMERDQYYGNIAVELRRIGLVKKLPVVTAVQVNREGINDKASSYGVQHIALSQFISNHTDILLSLRAIDAAQALASGVVDLEASIIKHRDGPKARFSIKANFERMTMKEHEIRCEDIPVSTEVPPVQDSLIA